MRRHTQPPLDLVPVMGLAALLVPILLVGQGISTSVLEANAPTTCAGLHHDHAEPVVVPSVHLKADTILLYGVDSHPETLKADALAELTARLGELKQDHATSGKVTLVSDSDVSYERLIAAMDASRAHFPKVMIAGGAPI